MWLTIESLLMFCYHHRLREALYNLAPSAATDLCHQDAMHCDSQGHIEDFMLAQFASVSGLNCKSFPPAFGSLPKLRRLDLSNNGLNTDVADVEAVLGNSRTLRWLMLWATGLTGTLSCDLLSPSLTLVSLTRNDIEVGRMAWAMAGLRQEKDNSQVQKDKVYWPALEKCRILMIEIISRECKLRSAAAVNSKA
jgi:hypothetical protein